MSPHLHRTNPRETPMGDKALEGLVEFLKTKADDTGINICCGCLCELLARLSKVEQELAMARRFMGVLQ